MASGICPTAPTTYTTSELQATFPGSVLPSGASRTSEGLMTDAALNAHIASLKSAGVIPTRPIMEQLPSGTDANDPNTPLARYIQADNVFLNKIKTEFCFYEGRYRVALTTLLNNVASASLPSASTAATNSQRQFEIYLPITKKLNEKLNDVTQIANAVAIERYRLSRSDNTDINKINADLASRADELKAQQKILSSDVSKAELHKRMVDYTKEKNNATTNLLTLYAVLNIVAIGALVILARTS
uniref:Uncharacterized protein n=1 Tax=viral metagenome TaxID=1070528 RepID=A0A6C0IBI9_9ZZZZ